MSGECSSEPSEQRKRTINLPVSHFFSKTKFLKNQQCLLGSILNVMTNEKLFMALVRIQKEDKSFKSIPLSFKLGENDIPKDLSIGKIQLKNMVEIIVEKEKIPAFLVATGDDSNQLYKNYKGFLEYSKSSKMPPVESKVSYCIAVEGLKVKKLECKYLPSVSQQRFNEFIKKVEEIKKNQAKYNLRQTRVSPLVPNQKKKKSTPEKSHTDTKEKPTTSSARITPKAKDSKKKSPLKKDMPNVSDKSSEKVDNRAKFMSYLQKMANSSESMEASNTKQFCETTIKTLNFLGKLLIPESCLTEDISIRVIPEVDLTESAKDITVIEGLLPVYTTKYKKAIYTKSLKLGDNEPTIIIANIVRYAFPLHWVRNVTLKGQGRRKSLISLWNYKNPLLTTLEGPSMPGLGEKRFRALLDHVVRKCGKKSYDTRVEKSMVSAFAKALHYSRSRLMDGESSNKDMNRSDLSDSDDDDDSSVSEDSESDSSGDDSAPVEILCTPKISDFLSGIEFEEQEQDFEDIFGDEEVYEASTINGDSVKDFRMDGNEIQAVSKEKNKNEKPTTIIQKVSDSAFKQPASTKEKESRGNKSSSHEKKDAQSGDSSKKASPSTNRVKKVEYMQNIFHSQPVPSTSNKRPSTSESTQHSLSKKPKKSVVEKVRNQSSPRPLSQDESNLYARIMSQDERAATKPNESRENDDDGEDDVFGAQDADIDSPEEGEISDE